MRESIFTVLPDPEPIPIQNEVEGIPPLPVITDPIVKRIVVETLRLNPFLEEPQVPVVIRYAETRRAYDYMYERMIRTDDFMNDVTEQPSAVFKIVNTLNSQLQKMERDLAISTVARETTVAKDKQKVPQGTGTRAGRAQRKIA